MPKFNHAYDFTFEVISDDFYAKDVTGAMLRQALVKRIESLSDDGLLEACGAYDVYMIREDT